MVMLLSLNGKDEFHLIILLSQKDKQILFLFLSLWQLSKILESITEQGQEPGHLTLLSQARECTNLHAEKKNLQPLFS